MEQQIETSNSVTTRSVGIRYGAISAVIGIAYFVILNVAQIDMTQGFWNWFGWIITILMIVLAHKYFKDNGDGFMSYGQGIGIAFWLGLISGTISSIFTYLYVKFIDGNMLETIKERQIEGMQSKGMSEEQIDQAMKISAMFTSAEAILVFGFIGSIAGALIIALIVTIFTQKKSPETTF